MYLDFETYQNMGGTLEETTFNEYEFTAETLVDWYTFNRLKNETTYPEKLTQLMYNLVKSIQIKMDALTNNLAGADGSIKVGGITRQSNDGVSTEFNTVSSGYVIDQLSDKKLGDMVKKFLNGEKNSLGQKLLYRGLYPGE